MNQLLWYYADLEKQKCLLEMNEEGGADNDSDFIAHLGGRRSNKVRRDSYYIYLVPTSNEQCARNLMKKVSESR